MSWWTEFRDGLETAAAVVVNYFYPGLGTLGYYVNSEGSQEQLRSALGTGAMFISGLAGAGAGNMENYSTLLGSAGSGAGEFAAATPESFEYTSEWANAGSSLPDAGTSAGMNDLGTFNDANYGTGMNPDTGASNVGPVGTAGGQANPYDNFGDLRGAPTQGQGNVFGATGAGPGAFNAAGTTGGNSLGGSLAGPAATAGKFGAGASMPWSSPGGILNTASGVLGLMGSGQMMGAAKNADPFAESRRKYAEQMGRLAENPDMIYTMPGYRAGEQAVKRAMAAQGYTGSGNALAALQKYGGDFYNQTMNLYGGLAGANVNPVDAARLGLQGKQAGIDLAGRSLGTLGYQSWMGGNQWPSFGG